MRFPIKLKQRENGKEGGQKEKKNAPCPPKTRNHTFFFPFD
jgi:hypothetical protein